MNKWAKFMQLTCAERRLLIKAFALLPLTALGLRALSFSRMQSVMSGPAFISKNVSAGENEQAQARLTARMVVIAANHGIYRASCLPRSLTLWSLLQRQGIESALRIGVRKAAGCLEAHAWVEHRGLPLNDSYDVCERFSAFDKTALLKEAGSQ